MKHCRLQNYSIATIVLIRSMISMTTGVCGAARLILHDLLLAITVLISGLLGTYLRELSIFI